MPAADWLAHHDAGSARGALLQPARDAARGQLLALSAGLFAAGALIFTARNLTLSRRTFELTEQGQVTGRYTKDQFRTAGNQTPAPAGWWRRALTLGQEELQGCRPMPWPARIHELRAGQVPPHQPRTGQARIRCAAEGARGSGPRWCW